ncbi:MAG: hypothetical protein LUG51_09140 [Tannerellaceae bacterium]|nr:hypothetical protein [Tannerellaceae bacterium]
MSELEKMRIVGYENSQYKGGYKEFTVQINPATIQWDKSIRYSKVQKEGSLNQPENKYVGYEDDKLSFKIVLDGTGAVPETTKTVSAQIYQLLQVIYNKVEESHEPRYVIVFWGAFCFEGRVSSFTQEFTLFSPAGIPLRATISLHLVSHLDKEVANKKVNEQSPDLTRVITLKAGESIPFWCNKIYEDASYCYEIAAYNGLENFRDVKPGEKIIFPPVERYG